jgi:uncharacterized membrane protein
MKPEISHKRHILKTITWRVLGTIDTIVISGILIGDWKVGLSIGGIEIISKMTLYYIHERVWYKSKFGIKNKKL